MVVRVFFYNSISFVFDVDIYFVDATTGVTN